MRGVVALILVLLMMQCAAAATITNSQLNGKTLTITVSGTPPFIINIRGDNNIGAPGGYVWAITNDNNFSINLDFAQNPSQTFTYAVKDTSWSTPLTTSFGSEQRQTINVRNIKAVEYPGPTYTQGCYHRGFIQGCFNEGQFRADVASIKAAGFNTLWVPAFRSDIQPQSLPSDVYNETNIANLNRMAQILKENNMYLITSPQYGIGGMFGIGYDEHYWIVKDDIWTDYTQYVAEFSRHLSANDNVIYIFFTEGTEPNRAVAATDPILQASFRAWAKGVRNDVAFWNARWGTDFASMDVIMPNPASNDGYNAQFLDYQRWTGSLLRTRFPQLPAIIKQNHPRALVGYHDYSLIELNWSGALWTRNDEQLTGVPATQFLPLPQDNQYDFFSMVYYFPYDTTTSQEVAIRYDRFGALYGKSPAFMGEWGYCDATAGSQENRALQLNNIKTFITSKGMGYNFWNWQDPALASSTCEGTLGLRDSQGQMKPVYNAVFG